MASLLLVPLTVVALATAVVFLRHHDAARQARALRRLGCGVMASFVLFAGLFIGGETLADPGGWVGVGLVASWLVPLVLLGTLAWRAPDVARPVSGAVVALVIGMSIWYAIDSGGWWAFENSHGPIRGIVLFAAGAVTACYGYHRPQRGGVQLLLLGTVPVLCSLAANGRAGNVSLIVIATPPTITGILYLLSALIGHSQPGRQLDVAESPGHEERGDDPQDATSEAASARSGEMADGL